MNPNDEPNNNSTNESNNELKEPYVDPVVDFLSKITFNTNIFEELNASCNDPEKWEQMFKTPDVYVLANAKSVLFNFDPNKGTDGQKDHDAMLNLLNWFIVKICTDPVWLSYLGWFIRFCSAHTNPSSYYPIKYHHAFNPNHFFVRNQEVKISIENQKFTDPAEVFQWKE